MRYQTLYKKEREVEMVENDFGFTFTEETLDFIKRFGGYYIEDANYPGVVYAGTEEEVTNDLFLNKSNPDYYEGECLVVCKV